MYDFINATPTFLGLIIGVAAYIRAGIKPKVKDIVKEIKEHPKIVV